MGILYAIVEDKEWWCYFGYTLEDSLEPRWQHHKKDATKKRPKGKMLRAIKKHGPERYEMVEICRAETEEELAALETQYINRHRTNKHGYNSNRTSAPRPRLKSDSKAKMSNGGKKRGLKVKRSKAGKKSWANTSEEDRQRILANLARANERRKHGLCEHETSEMLPPDGLGPLHQEDSAVSAGL